MKYFLLLIVLFFQLTAFSKNAYLVYVDSTHGPGMFGHILLYFTDQEINKELAKNYYSTSQKLPGDIYTFYIEMPNNQEMNWDNIFEFRAQSKFEMFDADKTMTDYLIRQNREVYFYMLNLTDSEIDQLKAELDHEVKIKKEYSNFNFNNTCAANIVRFINSVVTSDRIISQRIFKKWIMQDNTYSIWKIQEAYHSNNPVILNYSLKDHKVVKGPPIHFYSKELQMAGVLDSVYKSINQLNKFCQSEAIYKLLIRKSVYNNVNRAYQTVDLLNSKCFGNTDQDSLTRLKSQVNQINSLSKTKSLPKKFFL